MTIPPTIKPRKIMIRRKIRILITTNFRNSVPRIEMLSYLRLDPKLTILRSLPKIWIKSTWRTSTLRATIKTKCRKWNNLMNISNHHSHNSTHLPNPVSIKKTNKDPKPILPHSKKNIMKRSVKSMEISSFKKLITEMISKSISKRKHHLLFTSLKDRMRKQPRIPAIL